MKLSDYPTLAEFRAEVERRAAKLLYRVQCGATSLTGYGRVHPGTGWAEACIMVIDFEEDVLDIVGEA